MARKKISERQQIKVTSDRQMKVYKRDDMVQHSRHDLSLQAQKCILYAISKIKPDDDAFTEYIFDIKDFYHMCGVENESYDDLKAILIQLKSKSWWVEIDDHGTESAVSWFNTVKTNKGTGKVAIKFHEDMVPFLLRLTQQDEFYTGYRLQYVLPMSCQYSPRLYEILKSYQKNNVEWFFDVDDLKRILDCRHYANFYDFRRRVLDPSVEEINKFTDITVAYDTISEGRKIVRVVFYMVGKGKEDLLEAQQAGADVLDGQIDIDEMIAALEAEESVKSRFFREQREKRNKV